MLVFGDPNDGHEPYDSQEEIKAISLKFQRFNYIGIVSAFTITPGMILPE
jgi:hypothetical protein